MNAIEAIEKIKSEKTDFMGVKAQKHNYGHKIREQLEIIAETGELSPREFYRALKITWDKMSPAIKAQEAADLNVSAD